MLKEAIEYIKQLGVGAAKPTSIEINGRTYTDKELVEQKDPLPQAVTVHTLTGLADLIQARVNGFDPDKAIVVVNGPGSVHVSAKAANVWGETPVYIKATPDCGDLFPFGRFMPAEEFLIQVASKFGDYPTDTEYVLKQASGLTAEAVTTSQDDGISQTVGTRKGVVLADRTVLKSRVRLAPYRTFREVLQPSSDFLFRVKQQQHGEIPLCALFEADGGEWRMKAALAIKEWLDAKNLGIVVAA